MRQIRLSLKSFFILITTITILVFGMTESASAVAASVTENTASPWFTKSKKQVTLIVDVFTSSTCSHCKKLEAFLKKEAENRPWLNIKYHVINEDREALETYAQFLKKHDLTDFYVPAIFFCNSRWLGFANPETSGKILFTNLDYCKKQIQKDGELSPKTTEVLKQIAQANLYQGNYSTKMPDWAFPPLLALLDALSPESSFIILTLLCFILIEKKKTLQITSVILYLISIGFAHYFQQVYTDLFYDLVPFVRIPVALIGLGLLTYLFAFHPVVFAARRPLPIIISLIWVILTGFTVQIYQQMHLPNFSLTFQQWLVAQQDISTMGQWVYVLVYQLLYLLYIALSVGVLLLVLNYYGKWTRHQLVVVEFGWQYLTLIGFILLLNPYCLAIESYAVLGFILVLVTSWLSYKFWSKRHKQEHTN